MVADVLGTQAEMARMLRLESSTISQWLSGKRGAPDWHVVHEAIKRVLRRHPEAAPAFIETIAGDCFEAEGTWRPRPAGDPGDWSEEAEDVTIAQAGLTLAVRSGDAETVERAGRALVKEATEAHRAALAVVQTEETGRARRVAR
jgi:transcriptional regulator with XRE-family HTH domain